MPRENLRSGRSTMHALILNYSKCINIGGMHGVSLGSGLNKPAVPSHWTWMLMDSSLMGRLPIQPLEVVVCQSHHHHYYTAGPRDALLKESGGEREGAATYSHGSHEEKCG